MADGQPHPLEPVLRKLQQWKKLDQLEREAVLALPHIIEHPQRGQYLVREGDKPSHSCLLVSGFAYRHKILADGSRSISAIHMRGDIVDLQNSLLEVADHGVQALTSCTVAYIPARAIRDLAAAYPNVGMAMWRDTLIDGSIFREWIANIARRDAPARIAHLLCEFGVRHEAAGLGDRQSFELPMTQEQLADCTGLTAVHVNRSLKALEARGDITRSVRHVSIADWEKARDTGDFEEAYLHLTRETMLP